ncbi:MAG TPA: hypothetical protein VN634_20480 [Candidatus Limnocylindrales bacterium]|nr:hypothetical protein [Candidatus Limnocylindrales bacterium]
MTGAPTLPMVVREDASTRRLASAYPGALKQKGLLLVAGLFVLLAALLALFQPTLALLALVGALVVPLTVGVTAAALSLLRRWFPQRWIIDDKTIRLRGYQLIGTLPWKDIVWWSVRPVEGLDAYRQLVVGFRVDRFSEKTTDIVVAAELAEALDRLFQTKSAGEKRL